eukprot:1982707-Karenia_brevis.AAC.1
MGAPTFGEAQTSVPILCNIGFLGLWALGPGPLPASTGKDCSTFLSLEELPPLQEKGRAQERLRTGWLWALRPNKPTC